MKTDFSINVQVNLGVTPELVQLVSAILSHKPTNVQSDELLLDAHAQVEEKPEETAPAAPQQPTTKRGRKKKEEAAADAKPEPTKEKAGNEQQEAAANQADANNAGAENTQAAEQAPQGEAEQPKELTEEDVRAAMHRTRQRIEGEDYKEHTDSDAYKKYHKALTAQFKNIAALLGADKPSALPQDKRADFIEQCEYLQVLEDGTIGNNCPF